MGITMGRPIVTTFAMIALTGCAASYDSDPNAFQRAEVMSKNERGITVKHSTWGNDIAFRYADEHCESVDRFAVHVSTSQQTGPDVISSWRCEK